MLVLWRKFRATLGEVGACYTAYQVVKKVIPPGLFYVRRCYMMRTDLRPFADRQGGDPQLRWATEDDVDAIAAIMWDPARIRKHMRDGARVALLEDGDGVRACSWFRFGSADVDHWLRLFVPDDSVYSMYTFVVREHRGQGCFGRIVGFGKEQMACQGFQRSFNIVDSLNGNSWRATERTGGYSCGTLFAIGIFGWLAVRIGDEWRFGRWTPARRLHWTFT